jgi:hypothetical protein
LNWTPFRPNDRENLGPVFLFNNHGDTWARELEALMGTEKVRRWKVVLEVVGVPQIQVEG